MKNQKILFFILFSILGLNSALAQFSNGMNNGTNNGYGNSNRMSQNNMSQMGTPDKPREIPIEVTVGKIMEKLKTELTLDELQAYAVSNVLTETIKSQNKIIKAETSESDKIAAIQSLSESNERKIMSFLNKEQKAKYIALNEEAKNKKKKK